jgi:hypothetical protein
MSDTPMQAEFGKGKRVTGADRERFAVQLAQQYGSGLAIRELAAIHGRSYGNVRMVLLEAGVTLRKRGGPHH